MNEIQENSQLFKHFRLCLEAIYFTSHQENQSSGKMQEGKVHFSGKHMLYGLKVEIVEDRTDLPQRSARSTLDLHRI